MARHIPKHKEKKGIPSELLRSNTRSDGGRTHFQVLGNAPRWSAVLVQGSSPGVTHLFTDHRSWGGSSEGPSFWALEHW